LVGHSKDNELHLAGYLPQRLKVLL
jgi:hypothetical protein